MNIYGEFIQQRINYWHEIEEAPSVSTLDTSDVTSKSESQLHQLKVHLLTFLPHAFITVQEFQINTRPYYFLLVFVVKETTQATEKHLSSVFTKHKLKHNTPTSKKGATQTSRQIENLFMGVKFQVVPLR